MVPEEYRARARQCRVTAARSGDPLRRDFLEAAEAWETLADQLERLQAIAGPPATGDDAGDAIADERR